MKYLQFFHKNMRAPAGNFVMMQLFPSRRTSRKWSERRARPSKRCSPAWARSNATWSSKGSSVKGGMYLAHSTSIRSCCFIESQTSVMLAIFLFEISFSTQLIYINKIIYYTVAPFYKIQQKITSKAEQFCPEIMSAFRREDTERPFPTVASS